MIEVKWSTEYVETPNGHQETYHVMVRMGKQIPKHGEEDDDGNVTAVGETIQWSDWEQVPPGAMNTLASAAMAMQATAQQRAA